MMLLVFFSLQIPSCRFMVQTIKLLRRRLLCSYTHTDSGRQAGTHTRGYEQKLRSEHIYTNLFPYSATLQPRDSVEFIQDLTLNVPRGREIHEICKSSTTASQTLLFCLSLSTFFIHIYITRQPQETLCVFEKEAYYYTQLSTSFGFISIIK